MFWGDLDSKFRAFDAASGKILWEATLGGSIDNSTITGGLITQAGIQPARRHNEIYVFALPDQR